MTNWETGISSPSQVGIVASVIPLIWRTSTFSSLIASNSHGVPFKMNTVPFSPRVTTKPSSKCPTRPWVPTSITL